MAQINNSELTKSLIDGARLNTGRDKIPDQIAEKVVPILDTTPDFHRLTEFLASDAQTATQAAAVVYTTHATKKTYLTGVYLQNMSNATADNTSISLSVIPKGRARDFILRFMKLTTTAFSQSQFISFNKPLRLEENTTVLFASAFTVGASVSSIQVYGYEVDP